MSNTSSNTGGGEGSMCTSLSSEGGGVVCILDYVVLRV